MATSVLSEHAFSSAGIIITKHWNYLKPNIVEVLQCLKCMIKHELLFCQDPSVVSKPVDDTSSKDKTSIDALNEDTRWDNIIENLGENEELWA